jgi:hypothetical protein
VSGLTGSTPDEPGDGFFAPATMSLRARPANNDRHSSGLDWRWGGCTPNAGAADGIAAYAGRPFQKTETLGSFRA